MPQSSDRIQEYVEAIADVKVRAVMQEIVVDNDDMKSRMLEYESRLSDLESRIIALES
jgi:hypothetical protein